MIIQKVIQLLLKDAQATNDKQLYNNLVSILLTTEATLDLINMVQKKLDHANESYYKLSYFNTRITDIKKLMSVIINTLNKISSDHHLNIRK